LQEIVAKEDPEISVIICAYTMERLDDIHAVVNSILNQTLKAQEVILAIDNNKELFGNLQALVHNSKSGVADEKARTPARNSQVKITLNTGPGGASETRNVGIRAATGNILAFADDDIIAEPDWLENLVRPFEHGEIMAVSGQVVPTWPNVEAPYWFPEEFDFTIGCTAHKKLILQANNEIRNVVSCNAAFRKEVFATIGGWETALGPNRNDPCGKTSKHPGGEEAELCLRIKYKIPGASIVYEPQAIAHHKVTAERATLKYTLNRCYREGIMKSVMAKVASRYADNPLATEDLFLRSLLTISLPQRLKKLYKPANLAQIIVILVSAASTGLGYFVGKWRYKEGNN
jgi:glycosyltransferase involved in cell wall biosynthesis